MKKDMNRMLVESTIRRVLKNIQESPERTIRNLVDLGLDFCGGRFQTQFLETMQKMLSNQNSAYYELAKDVAASVDHDILINFSRNLGYNGCTKGAKVIRELEAKRGFNIPWALNLVINEEKLETVYPDLLRQGEELGIYTYLLFADCRPERIIPLLRGQPDSAFVLVLHSYQIDVSFIQKIKPVKNAMIAVCVDKDTKETCQKLRNSGLLCAVYQSYGEADKPYILSGNWLASVLPARPVFAFLQAEPSCCAATQKEIYDYVISVRDGQQYPVVLMDVKQDTMMIDQVVSDGVCLAGFDAEGNLITHEGLMQGEQYNIFQNRLEEVLERAEIK